MNAFLDTYALLWAARQPERLSAPVRALLLHPDTELTVSVVSAWEIALKPELGVDDVARSFREAARHLHPRILPVRLEQLNGPITGSECSEAKEDRREASLQAADDTKQVGGRCRPSFCPAMVRR
jgi:hypothetical protein